MSTGLIALLDDIAALAKVAAATLDDAAAQATKVGAKAAGVVIDDAAVTPRYVTGFTADRELPIIWKIAVGSLRNKLLIILPIGLLLSVIAPWIITPLLMVGGAYLCLEGFHKVLDYVRPHAAHHAHGAEGESHGDANAALDPVPMALGPKDVENQRVESAIRTDFILSAEIMAIALAAVQGDFLFKAAVLAVVGVGMTVLVYGAVALIVRADDAGVSLARSKSSAMRAIGRGLVTGMPHFLRVLSFIGMIAMLWVGGGILLHGLAGLGWAAPEHLVHDIAHGVGHAVAPLEGVLSWFVGAALAGLIGLGVGAVVAPLAERVIAPGWAWAKASWIGRGKLA